jgi:hypothetical protein
VRPGPHLTKRLPTSSVRKPFNCLSVTGGAPRRVGHVTRTTTNRQLPLWGANNPRCSQCARRTSIPEKSGCRTADRVPAAPCDHLCSNCVPAVLAAQQARGMVACLSLPELWPSSSQRSPPEDAKAHCVQSRLPRGYPELRLTCLACGEQFMPDRSSAQYCSFPCRRQAYRSRWRAMGC